MLPDGGAFEVEDIRDQATREGDESQERARPLVAQTAVHLLREEDDTGAPEASDARLCGQGAGRLVLVGVDKVVVGRVVQEDEAKADGESSHHGSPVRETRVGGPTEDEQADGDEPTGEHHRNESSFRGWFAVGGLRAETEIVLVDERRAARREEDADRQWDEHETRATFGPSFSVDVNDRIGHEKHVQKPVEDRHVQ